jgi:hypothetical protein
MEEVIGSIPIKSTPNIRSKLRLFYVGGVFGGCKRHKGIGDLWTKVALFSHFNLSLSAHGTAAWEKVVVPGTAFASAPGVAQSLRLVMTGDMQMLRRRIYRGNDGVALLPAEMFRLEPMTCVTKFGEKTLYMEPLAKYPARTDF